MVLSEHALGVGKSSLTSLPPWRLEPGWHEPSYLKSLIEWDSAEFVFVLVVVGVGFGGNVVVPPLSDESPSLCCGYES